ncbi:GNAT family N-acetyltransferase [Motilimonas sp. E26]|uniref:GNAT family N-acetyltransferase n=1 Tax=Motilimonas TaxID=1914248 RepID=UPI001E3A4537|nr:GNAT family N-acetyltransferase [Motilimonas sp. E26]
MITSLGTQRLILRQWQDEDYAPFAQMSADENVMRYFPNILTRADSDALADKAKGLIADNGWGFWAVELKETGEFIGFIGLHCQEDAIPNTPFIEVGWRLAKQHWGKGYAPEGAQAALAFAFEQLDQPAIYAFTTLTNLPSQRVMTKLGMINIEQNFLHPKLAPEHPLAPHCLYRITKQQFNKQQSQAV